MPTTPLARALLVALTTLAASAPGAWAQVVFDGTMGPAGPAPTRSVPGFDLDHLITYDARTPATDQGILAGGNLFQSLEQFSVGANDRATFQAFDALGNPLSLDNVIARITGNDPSNIAGVIRSEVLAADLFLLNPNGILFSGPDAIRQQLDVQGSFFATTADSLRFSDGTLFEVANLSAPNLSVSAPSAFGFLGGSNGALGVNQSVPMAVSNGETLMLVGSDVEITNATTLQAFEGEIRSAAIGNAALEVPIDLATFDTSSYTAGELGRIDIDDDATVKTGQVSPVGDPQGRIVLRGGNLIVDFARVTAGGNAGTLEPAIDVDVVEEFVLSGGAAFSSIGGNAEGTGGIRIAADRLEVRETNSRLLLRSFGAGTNGDLEIEVMDLLVTDSGVIGTEGLSVSPGADLRIDADNVRVSAGGSIETKSTGSMPAGDLFINGASLEVTTSDNSMLPGRIASLSQSTGDGGDIVLDFDRVEISSNGQIASLAEDRGKGGDLFISANSLDLTGRGQIFAVATDRGDSGNVAVTTTGDIAIEGDDRLVPAGIFARSGFDISTAASGDGGNITLSARSIDMRGSAVVSARTFGAGHAGDVEITTASSVILAGDARGIPEISARALTGDGGFIHVETELLRLEGGAGITSSTLGSGQAGGIEIVAGDLVVTGTDGGANRSAILSEAAGSAPDAGNSGRIVIEIDRDLAVADGGQISVSTRGAGNSDLIDIRVAGRVDVSDGGEIASIARAAGTAGDIEIRGTGQVSVRDGGSITAASFGSGDAGSVLITDVGTVSIENGGTVSATATATGEAGDVTILADGIGIMAGSITTEARDGNDPIAGGNIRLVGAGGVSIEDAGLVSARTFGSQNAGEIEITSSQRVDLVRQSTVSAESVASCNPCLPGQVGDAGTISIDAGSEFFAQGSRVVTEAREAAGGDIRINANRLIESVDSRVATSVLGGIGGGGDIDIGTSVQPRFVVLNASAVRAQADLGDGGNIRIRTANFLASADSVLSATSNLGVDGTIIISTPEDQLKGNENRLPESFLDVTELLAEHCAARASESNSFVVRGRDGMPESPDLPLPSRMPTRIRTLPFQGTIPKPARQLAALDCSGQAILTVGMAP